MRRQGLVRGGAALLAAWVFALGRVPSRTDAQAPADTPRSLVVGVVRHDGLLVPVARFTGGEWEAAWFEPNDIGDAAASLERVRAEWFPADRLVRPQWSFWPLSPRGATSARPLALALDAPMQARSHCQAIIAVRTSGEADVLQRPVTPHQFPVQKLGLALSTSDVPVVVPAPVPPANLLLLRTHAQRAFRDAEDRFVAAMSAEHRLELPPLEQRMHAPVEWSHAYDLGEVDGTRVYLFEGSVTYSDITIFAGQVWLRQAGAGIGAEGDVTLGGDTYKTGATRLPLGSLRLAGRTFVVVEAGFYGGERFEIREWAPDAARPRLAIQQPGGGC